MSLFGLFLSKEEKLLNAVIRADKKEVKMLLENGADASTCNEDGWTGLMFASAKDHLIAASNQRDYHTVVEYLLKYGANIDAQSKDGGATALFIAVGNGNTHEIRLLLEHGANVHIKTHTGETPLSFASNKGHTSIVELLLGSGAKY